jgi:hypothetical protein
MDLMNYELSQARIATLKALRHPRQSPEAAWQRASLWETVTGWWQALKNKTARKKVAAAYRAELMRQEWMVERAPVKEPKV